MTMQSRRDRRQQDRRARGGRPTPGASRGARPGWIVPAAVAVLAIAAVFGLRAAGVFDPVRKIDASDSRFAPAGIVGTQHPEESKDHVPDGQTVRYKMSPPASGSHWATPLPWGSYDSPQPLERTVHNLEHGGIVVLYNGLTSDQVAQLKSTVSSLRSGQYRKIVLAPSNVFSDAKIAVSAWTWQLKLDTVDETPIIQFVRAHYDGPDAPEPGVP